jgi:hypothetical protein
MTMNITVRKKIIVNGREYQSVEEMPESIRNAYKKATVTAVNPGCTIDPGGSKVKIVFNGQEYKSMEDMPLEVRRIYDVAMAAVGTGRDAEADAWKPWERETALPATGDGEKFPFSIMSPTKAGVGDLAPSRSTWLIAGIMILMLLIVLYFLSGPGVSK